MKRIEVPNIEALISKKKSENKKNTSPLHEFIFKAREELKETATEGDGSFGFYLGMLKTIPISELYSMLSRAKEANTPIKSFWYSVGQYKKNEREQKSPFKIGERVRITRGPANKVGKVGEVKTIAANGVIIEIAPNMFTPVQFKHLEKI